MTMLRFSIALLFLAPAILAADSVVTPEPGTAVLLTIGIAGIGIGVWRGRKKH